MRRIAFAPAFALAVALLFWGCRDDGLINEMAMLDRAYVPALVLTASDDETGDAVMAVKNFKLEWLIFKARVLSARKDWGGALGEVEGLVMRADGDINAGDGGGAHEALKGVRQVMLRRRRAAGIEYFPDYLTDFHGVMEEILVAVEGKAPGSFGEADLRRLRRDLHRAAHRWEKVRTAGFDKRVFGLGAAEEREFKRRVEEESAALEALRAALKRGDEAGIIEAAGGLAPPFLNAFKLFGDFSRVKIK